MSLTSSILLLVMVSSGYLLEHYVSMPNLSNIYHVLQSIYMISTDAYAGIR